MKFTVPSSTRVTTPVLALIVATASLSPLQVTVAPETAVPPSVKVTEALNEPAAVPFFKSVFVMPESSMVVVVAAAEEPPLGV